MKPSQPPPAPAPELLAAFVEQGRDAGAPDAVSPIGEEPAPALATSLPSFLPGSCVQKADLDAGTPSSAASTQNVSLRGVVLAPATNPAVSHPDESLLRRPSAEGPEDIRVLPASAVVPRGMFSMAGSLMHVFVSYRVSTEGIVLTLHQSSAETSFCLVALSSLANPP